MTSIRDVTMGDIAAELAFELIASIGNASGWLPKIPVGRTGERPRRGGWSAREIMGHLIDSASNNHGRFVRAALDDSMVFPTYDQEGWVAVQHYQDEHWQTLLHRWQSFNDQIASTILHIPAERLTIARREHNLDRIAWKTVAANEPVTLAYFIRDYIGHLAHHLAQIAALCEVTEAQMRVSRCKMGQNPGA
jgi:hypothetical protein